MRGGVTGEEGGVVARWIVSRNTGLTCFTGFSSLQALHEWKFSLKNEQKSSQGEVESTKQNFWDANIQ